MKLGFYSQLKRISPFDWNQFLNFDIGLSGMDSSYLKLVHYLSTQNYDLTIFSDFTMPVIGNMKSESCLSFEESIQKASDLGISIVLIIHNESQELKDGISLASKLGIKVLVWGQNSPSVSTSNFYFTSQSVKRFVCVSLNQANNMRHHALFEKCVVVPNGINIRNFDVTLSKRENIVTFVGAISENKGLHWLLKIWPKVVDQIPEAKLQIIGSAKLYSRDNELGFFGFGSKDFEEKYVIPVYGKQRDALEKYNIKTLGLCSPKEIIHHLSESMVGVVNPNFSYSMAVETFCVSAVEIQACKTLVLGGKAGGLLDTVSDRKSGYLCTSEVDLSRKLIDCLKNKPKTEAMGRVGYEFVKANFELDAIFPLWVRLFDDVRLEMSPKSIALNPFKVEKRVLLKEFIRLGRRILTIHKG